MALDDIKDDLGQLQEDSKAYIDSTVEYYKLRGFKAVTKSTSMFMRLMVMTIISLMVIIFASIAAAIAIGEALENASLGFLIVAGFYFVLYIVLKVAKPRLFEKSILKKFSHIFFND